MNAVEFRALEQAFDDASAAVAAAREAERAAYAVLDAARCNRQFAKASDGHSWRCTLQAGHAADCSNRFSRGEAR